MATAAAKGLSFARCADTFGPGLLHRAHLEIALWQSRWSRHSDWPCSKVSEMMDICAAFQLVCASCDALGIVLVLDKDAERAPSATPIRCRNCGAVRGTLGDLPDLAQSKPRDLIDFP